MERKRRISADYPPPAPTVEDDVIGPMPAHVVDKGTKRRKGKVLNLSQFLGGKFE